MHVDVEEGADRPHVRDLEPIHVHGPRRDRDVRTRTDQLVRPLTVDLDRRDLRRHLQDVSAQRLRRPVDLLAGDRARVGARADLSLGVVGRGRLAEPDRRVVALVGQREVAEQPGRTPEAEQQDAGGHRVEGAGVADLARPGEPADPCDHIVRGPLLGLVDDEQSLGCLVAQAELLRSSSSPSSSSAAGRR